MQPRIAALCAVFLAALYLFPLSAARACLNDRDSDSLAAEGGDLPHILHVLVGRFERNPPLFYAMRLKRVTAEIARAPDSLSLYDDAAVACDRLGRQDEAIAWIEKKRARLEGRDRTDPDVKEHWYRYYANAGTFWAHRWIKAGARRDRIHEMRRARDYIAKGLKLKPNAHFNREPYQLAAMEWLITGEGKPLREFIGIGYGDEAQPVVEGLSGLIVLGNAWESVDVYDALALALATNAKQKLSYLAMLRVKELLAAGRKSFAPDHFDTEKEVETSIVRGRHHFPPTNTAVLEEKYRELRADAEKWQQARLDYMLPRLRVGQHPDTDLNFWHDFRPPAPPSLEGSWLREAPENFQNWFFLRYGVLTVLFYLFIGLVLFALWRAFRRWRNRMAHPPL
jgi:hypothetical protein